MQNLRKPPPWEIILYGNPLNMLSAYQLLTIEIEDSRLCDRKGSICSYNSVSMLYWIRCGMCLAIIILQNHLSWHKQPLPLMNIVFGNLVGEFNGYFTPGSSTTEAEFKSSINQLRSVSEAGKMWSYINHHFSLYIVYLFIAKFCLTYISMVSQNLAPLLELILIKYSFASEWLVFASRLA